MPILLARFAQGVVSPTTQVQVISGQIDGPTNAAGSVLGGVGGFNYTIDGLRHTREDPRMDGQNLFDAVQWGNPNLDPTSTNFGRITTATNSIMRFFTFVARYSF